MFVIAQEERKDREEDRLQLKKMNNRILWPFLCVLNSIRGVVKKRISCFHADRKGGGGGFGSAATFHSVSFSKPNPVCFGKVTPKNCIQFSKPIPVWFGKKKNDFARRRFQTKFRLVWKILMTIVNVLKIPNQIQFGLDLVSKMTLNEI